MDVRNDVIKVYNSDANLSLLKSERQVGFFPSFLLLFFFLTRYQGDVDPRLTEGTFFFKYSLFLFSTPLTYVYLVNLHSLHKIILKPEFCFATQRPRATIYLTATRKE